MAHQFFVNDLKYTQTVSSFKPEHIYGNYRIKGAVPSAINWKRKLKIRQQGHRMEKCISLYPNRLILREPSSPQADDWWCGGRGRKTPGYLIGSNFFCFFYYYFTFGWCKISPYPIMEFNQCFCLNHRAISSCMSIFNHNNIIILRQR